jgi:hypothetical protein
MMGWLTKTDEDLMAIQTLAGGISLALSVHRCPDDRPDEWQIYYVSYDITNSAATQYLPEFTIAR